ncbi:MAG: NADH-quinone oxidoreductase subunit NuoK [Methylacidiphilales bacterium]|nr:NADH-quinone oxidoreductase subunit NuoK [Candidatus Methylacidiphilales bacterium]
MTITLVHYLSLGACLFAIGLIGIILRRNLITLYLCLELMLNGTNLTLVAFSRFLPHLDGQILVFFIITVAAAEVAVGLALIVAIFRLKQTTQADDLRHLRY